MHVKGIKYQEYYLNKMQISFFLTTVQVKVTRNDQVDQIIYTNEEKRVPWLPQIEALLSKILRGQVEGVCLHLA